LPTYTAKRADIVDRNGVLLATNLTTFSIYANPQRIMDAAQAAMQLATVFPDMNVDSLHQLLQRDGQFVWVQRNITPQQMYAVNRLGIPGVYSKLEESRVYPHGDLLAHIIGFTDVDTQGLAGVERRLNTRLLSQPDAPLALSIDVRVQHILAEELQKNIDFFDGIGGMGVVLDAQTGQVVAMVSLPSFNPNQPGRADPNARFNRATLGVYEMGSTMKIFTQALAHERGMPLDALLDARHPIRIGRFTINDFRGKARMMTAAEVFKYSSNIGTVRMIDKVGIAPQRQFLHSLGLLRPATLEVSEMGAPLLPSEWKRVQSFTVAFGHGISINAIQLVNAVAAMINGGTWQPATLLQERLEPVTPVKVLSDATSHTMRQLMYLTTQEGTGSYANVKGYFVGGKTGTSEKIVNGRYQKKKLMSSFVGAFPMHEPKYVVMAMVDEPKGRRESHGYATGGWVAAPVVGRVIARMAPLVGIHPYTDEDGAIAASLRIADGKKEAALVKASR
jgi:cell division protein FtsI (penicillin-binding protein 3)